MHNIGPQRKKVCDQAQLQRVGRILKLCIACADQFAQMQCMQQSVLYNGTNKAFINHICRYANKEGLI